MAKYIFFLIFTILIVAQVVAGDGETADTPIDYQPSAVARRLIVQLGQTLDNPKIKNVVPQAPVALPSAEKAKAGE